MNEAAKKLVAREARAAAQRHKAQIKTYGVRAEYVSGAWQEATASYSDMQGWTGAHAYFETAFRHEASRDE